MIKIDLITGFLGSGKTTFIRHYARHLMDEGKTIAIIENDYGAINVDRMILGDLDSDQCDVEMVIGGDADCRRNRLRAKLVSLGMVGYDRVIMEPSGIFDADEFFDMLSEEPFCRWYEIGSVITVVDAALENTLSEESDYLLVSQNADAGIIVMSKTQTVSGERLQQTLGHLNRAFVQFHCERRVPTDAAAEQYPDEEGTMRCPVLTKNWADYTAEDFARIEEAGHVASSFVKLPVAEDNSYNSFFYMNVQMSAEEVREQAKRLFADSEAGQVFRIKGFVQEGDHWIEINATPEKVEMEQVQRGQAVVLVIGEHLDQERIASYWRFEYGTGREGIH